MERTLYKADTFSRYEMSVSFEITLSKADKMKMLQVLKNSFPKAW